MHAGKIYPVSEMQRQLIYLSTAYDHELLFTMIFGILYTILYGCHIDTAIIFGTGISGYDDIGTACERTVFSGNRLIGFAASQDVMAPGDVFEVGHIFWQDPQEVTALSNFIIHADGYDH
jgi:hypothetical protein